MIRNLLRFNKKHPIKSIAILVSFWGSLFLFCYYGCRGIMGLFGLSSVAPGIAVLCLLGIYALLLKWYNLKGDNERLNMDLDYYTKNNRQ